MKAIKIWMNEKLRNALFHDDGLMEVGSKQDARD
jgi:hypothetical protein